METINERIKLLRSTLKLNQTDFGNAIGLTKSRISAYEKDEDIPDRAIKSICREFKADYFWLRDGVGEMFMESPDFLLDELAEEYKMSDLEKEIMMNYLKMDKETRNAFIETIKNLFNISE